MPKAFLRIENCQPERCDRGICQARKHCPVKAIFQEEPHEVPFLSAGMCNGCAKCIEACPLKAISLN
ncbi:MAG: 4Fe-4S binding protein [Dehalococcoidia bacterium]|nr:4Fe-4S binding protein [Dehalococcoidia bacterium]